MKATYPLAFNSRSLTDVDVIPGLTDLTTVDETIDALGPRAVRLQCLLMFHEASSRMRERPLYSVHALDEATLEECMHQIRGKDMILAGGCDLRIRHERGEPVLALTQYSEEVGGIPACIRTQCERVLMKEWNSAPRHSLLRARRIEDSLLDQQPKTSPHWLAYMEFVRERVGQLHARFDLKKKKLRKHLLSQYVRYLWKTVHSTTAA